MKQRVLFLLVSWLHRREHSESLEKKNSYCFPWDEQLSVWLVCLIYFFFKTTIFIVGKTKCMSKTGDCVVKHGANFTTGFGMVVSVICALFAF